MTSLCDYITIASTSNSTHVKSLTEEVIKVLKENNKIIQNVEKDDNFTWIVIDCDDFIINIFHNREREFYNLEELWVDAEEVFISWDKFIILYKISYNFIKSLSWKIVYLC